MDNKNAWFWAIRDTILFLLAGFLSGWLFLVVIVSISPPMEMEIILWVFVSFLVGVGVFIGIPAVQPLRKHIGLIVIILALLSAAIMTFAAYEEISGRISKFSSGGGSAMYCREKFWIEKGFVEGWIERQGWKRCIENSIYTPADYEQCLNASTMYKDWISGVCEDARIKSIDEGRYRPDISADDSKNSTTKTNENNNATSSLSAIVSGDNWKEFERDSVGSSSGFTVRYPSELVPVECPFQTEVIFTNNDPTSKHAACRVGEEESEPRTDPGIFYLRIQPGGYFDISRLDGEEYIQGIADVQRIDMEIGTWKAAVFRGNQLGEPGRKRGEMIVYRPMSSSAYFISFYGDPKKFWYFEMMVSTFTPLL